MKNSELYETVFDKLFDTLMVRKTNEQIILGNCTKNTVHGGWAASQGGGYTDCRAMMHSHWITPFLMERCYTLKGMAIGSYWWTGAETRGSGHCLPLSSPLLGEAAA